jgi:hypothetical protein
MGVSAEQVYPLQPVYLFEKEYVFVEFGIGSRKR